jgi:hypothetical protein
VPTITPAKSDQDFMKVEDTRQSARSPLFTSSSNGESGKSHDGIARESSPLGLITNTAIHVGAPAGVDQDDIAIHQPRAESTSEDLSATASLRRLQPENVSPGKQQMSNHSKKECSSKASTERCGHATIGKNSQIEAHYAVRRKYRPSQVPTPSNDSTDVLSTAQCQLQLSLHTSKAFRFTCSQPARYTLVQMPVPHIFAVHRTAYWTVERLSRISAAITSAFGT